MRPARSTASAKPPAGPSETMPHLAVAADAFARARGQNQVAEVLVLARAGGLQLLYLARRAVGHHASGVVQRSQDGDGALFVQFHDALLRPRASRPHWPP
jgi:hypothetical protein